MISYLSPNLHQKLELIKRLLAPHTKRAYIVGGATRDMIMGNAPKDLDIEIFDIDESTLLQIANKIGACGVGKSYFVYKWDEVDLSLPRGEKKVGTGHKAFEVFIVKSEKEASSRRDFKMNALMLNIFDGTLLDFWGGVDDIKNKTISIVDERRFGEDSLRVLRAIQFAARFGFKIDRRDLTMMRDIELFDLSHSRIVWELQKIFDAKHLHYGLYYFFSLGTAEKLFGLQMSKREFFKTAFELAKNRSRFEPHNREFEFFYILAKNLHINPLLFCQKLELPNIYKKRLQNQKSIPKNVTDRFLAALSIRYPISLWLGNYHQDIKKRAQQLNIYNEPYNGGCFARDVAKEGYSGSEIAKEHKRRLLMKVVQNFK